MRSYRFGSNTHWQGFIYLRMKSIGNVTHQSLDIRVVLLLIAKHLEGMRGLVMHVINVLSVILVEHLIVLLLVVIVMMHLVVLLLQKFGQSILRRRL